MQKFVSANPAVNDTLEAARRNVRRLNAIGQQTFGMVAFVEGGGGILEETDFASNGVGQGDAPAYLGIRMRVGKPATEEQVIPQFGEYQLSAAVTRLFATTVDGREEMARLMAEFAPGISSAEVSRQIMALPGVGTATDAAIAEFWAKA